MTAASFAAPTAKGLYVGTMRALGRAASATGFADFLEDRRDSRWAHWALSLFSIHDIDGLVRLGVPWWSYGAIEAVDGFLGSRPNARVFEWGSGASTIWLAYRAAEVISVEHDAAWADIPASRLRGFPHVTLALAEPDEEPHDHPLYLSQKPGWVGESFFDYATAIENVPGTAFDLIVIDGRARQACLAHAIDRLAPGGIIVFDNSGRDRYRRAIAKSGLASRTYRGLTPSLPYPDETTLLWHPDDSAPA